MTVELLSIDEVRGIHHALVDMFDRDDDPISPPGIKSQALLESAVGRQLSGTNGCLHYDTPTANAATLFYGLCMNHPFHNGNKRTALVAMLVHLDRNHLMLTNVRESAVYDFILAVASHRLNPYLLQYTDARTGRQKRKLAKEFSSERKLKPAEEIQVIQKWLEVHTRRIERGERSITLRDLKRILARYGYELEEPDQNRVKIYKTEEVVARKRWFGTTKKRKVKKIVATVRSGGMGRTVPINIVKYVRQECRLREEDGVDSGSFYDGHDALDYFMNEYRNVLKRLAIN